MKRFFSVALFVSALFVVAVAACDGAPAEHSVTLGQACDDDVDCVAGLLCITAQELDPNSAELSCIDGDKFCTVSCAVDDDCKDVGDGVICVSEADTCDGACFVGSKG